MAPTYIRLAGNEPGPLAGRRRFRSRRPLGVASVAFAAAVGWTGVHDAAAFSPSAVLILASAGENAGVPVTNENRGERIQSKAQNLLHKAALPPP